MKQKTTYFILLLLLIPFLVLSQDLKKDTIYGNIKRIREKVVFLTEIENPQLLYYNDYGHSGFMGPESTISRFYKTWYTSNFCYYINYERFYNPNRKITKENWYGKKDNFMNSYRYVYDKKERLIRMKYNPGDVSKTTKILFPIVVTVIAGLVAPKSVALVGFLMFGNLIRECGVLNNLSETAQNSFANIITILLGITVAGQMHYKEFVQPATLLILGLGLVAFVFDTIGGVVFAKFLNLFLPKDKKINPMIGAAGISAFPMSGRVVNQMGLKEDNQNFLLMQSISVNVSGQIASVIAGGLILTLVS
jgi:hypothetical protein